MNFTRGYYSLIQYCPDDSRAEAANIGVVLYCPERHFLDLIMSRGNERVRRFFGSERFDATRLNDAKKALSNRLQCERTVWKTREDFWHFVETRTNGLTLTEPRPVKVSDADAELHNLYQSLVMERANAELSPIKKSQLRQRMNQLFQRPKVQSARVANPRIEVPVTGAILTSSYGFQNGKLNIIVPLLFNTNTKRRAKELAIDGDLLRKHAEAMETPAALWVTLALAEDAEQEKERESVSSLLGEYNVPVYREENLAELERDVEAALH